MHPFDLHPDFYNNPILLTEEELANPMLVIKQFFEDSTLIEVRICLTNLLETALTRPNTIYDDANHRDIALYFVKRMLKLIEATNLMTKM